MDLVDLTELTDGQRKLIESFNALNVSYNRTRESAQKFFAQEAESAGRRSEREKSFADLRVSLGKTVFNALKGFSDALTEGELAAVNRRIAAQKDEINAASGRLANLSEAEERASGDERKRLRTKRAAQETALLQEKKGLEDLQTQKDKLEKQAAARKKTIALAETAINVAQGIAEATAKYGSNPLTAPFLPLAIAGIVAAGALQIAAIQAVPLKKGTLSVRGGVPGVDSVPALLTPGEAVIPADRARRYRPVLSAILGETVAPERLNFAALLPPERYPWGNIPKSTISAHQSPDLTPLLRAIERLPYVQFNLDKKGFSAAIIDEMNETYILNQKYRL